MVRSAQPATLAISEPVSELLTNISSIKVRLATERFGAIPLLPAANQLRLVKPDGQAQRPDYGGTERTKCMQRDCLQANLRWAMLHYTSAPLVARMDNVATNP